MQAKEFIVGGIDIDCGKTYITGILARQLKKAGRKIITSKLIQTGCKGISEDIIEHRRLMEIELLPEDKTGQTCPYVLSFPASPHLATELDNIEIDLNKIRKSNHVFKDKYEIILTEAAGGLMVPITKNYLTINYIKDSGVPLILVSSSKLGSINHTLLSLEICLKYNIELPLMIYNKLPGDDEVIAKDSFAYFKEYLASNFPATQLIHINELIDIVPDKIEAFNG